MHALDLDRISPSRRPTARNEGTQRWRELAFLHWSVPLDAVRPLVSRELELDPWDGRAWVSIVPFRMEAMRPRWAPRRIGVSFLEVNVRTYVHHRGRPGLWMLSLDASSWLTVLGARSAYGLPFHHARMSARTERSRVRYASRRTIGRSRFEVEYDIGRFLGRSQPGTLDHFLHERYLVFGVRDGRVHEGQVHHAPYELHETRIDRVHDELIAAAGIRAAGRAPDAIRFSPGVEVEAFGPRIV